MRPRIFNPYVTIALSVVLDALAQMLLKIGADHSVDKGSLFGVTGLMSGWVWLGILTMIISFAAWLYSLKYVPLNVAANLTGSVHVLVPLVSWIFLGERISSLRWLGILMVIAGVFIVARPMMKAEEKMEGGR